MAGTLPAQAIAMIAFDFVPDVAQRTKREIGQRAVVRGLGPRANLSQLRKLFFLVEQALGAAASALRIRRKLR